MPKKGSRTGVMLPCLQCGVLVYRQGYRQKICDRVFCNRTCYMLYRRIHQNGRAYLTEENPFKGKEHTQETKDTIGNLAEKRQRIHGSASKGRPRLDMIGGLNPVKRLTTEQEFARRLAMRLAKRKSDVAITNDEYIERSFGPTWESLKAATLKLDNYQCRACSKKDCRLEVHHILPRRVAYYDIEPNLITLCSRCHRQLESWTRVYINQPYQWWKSCVHDSVTLLAVGIRQSVVEPFIRSKQEVTECQSLM